MNAQTSSDWRTTPRRPDRTLIVGVNWIGDTIMSMPAIEAWRCENPDAHLSLLVKKNLAPLWELHSGPDGIIPFDDSTPGTFAAGKSLRNGRYDRAVVFPNSFRSALVPYLARIPERAGTPGQLRGLLLTEKIAQSGTPGREHQAYEYFRLLGLDAPVKLEAPHLKISDGARESATTKLEGLPRPLVGLIPGAARGPAKRWPAEHFAEVARQLSSARGCGIILFGGPDDFELCEQIREESGGNARNFAGKTSLKDWAALLACCDLVICNDSGGMHLAAAAGVPLVAIYGLTDPVRTGPLGAKCAIIRDETAAASRDIPRDSAAARTALAAIVPQRVLDAALPMLDKKAD